MSKTSLSFSELIELVDASVKSGKIENDYCGFVKCCRELGISSYVLNTIIVRAKENDKDDYGIKRRDVDYCFFVSATPQKVKEPPVSNEVQNNTREEKNGQVITWVLICALLICWIAEAIHNYNVTERNNHYVVLLKGIYEMTDSFSEDPSFCDWQSTNRDNLSVSHENYSFVASKGDKLSFDYYVSSEPLYDFLTITLSGDSISSKQLVRISGDSHGSRTYVFEKGGQYNLLVKYSKDGSYGKNNDNAGVSNIRLRSNYKNILERIRTSVIKVL